MAGIGLLANGGRVPAPGQNEDCDGLLRLRPRLAAERRKHPLRHLLRRHSARQHLSERHEVARRSVHLQTTGARGPSRIQPTDPPMGGPVPTLGNRVEPAGHAWANLLSDDGEGDLPSDEGQRLAEGPPAFGGKVRRIPADPNLGQRPAERFWVLYRASSQNWLGRRDPVLCRERLSGRRRIGTSHR